MSDPRLDATPARTRITVGPATAWAVVAATVLIAAFLVGM